MTPDDPRHGTPNGYTNQKCRCRPCTDAWAATHRAYMARHPEQKMRAALHERLKYAAGGAVRGINPHWRTDPRQPALFSTTALAELERLYVEESAKDHARRTREAQGLPEVSVTPWQ